MPLKRIHLFVVGADGEPCASLLGVCQQRWPALPLTAVPDCDAALAALRDAAGEGYARLPFLILLDLRWLPVCAGLAFLRQLRQEPALRPWPVFVLGAATQAQEIGALYDFGIAAYLHKANLDDPQQQFADLLDAYLNVVEFPMFDGSLRHP